jgi:hypothetical protein
MEQLAVAEPAKPGAHTPTRLSVPAATDANDAPLAVVAGHEISVGVHRM